MKKFLSLLAIGLLLILAGCLIIPGQNEITLFVFSAADNPGLSTDVEGTIEGSSINVTLPSGTNVTALVPTIVVSPGARVSPAGGVAYDFTSPVTYTVTARVGAAHEYTVTVDLEAPQGNISGVVVDAVTGAPVPGATVVFGDRSAMTDGTGAFNVTADSTVSSYAVFKDLTYAFVVIDGFTLDPSTSPVYRIRLAPYSSAGYDTVNISGGIAPSGAGGALHILNENGGEGYAALSNVGGETYSTSTSTYGANCLVVPTLVDSGGTTLGTYYLTTQDLSVDTTGFDLLVPAGFDTVTLNGTDGTMFSGHLLVPGYRGVYNYLQGMLYGSAQTTANIYNPNGYDMQWWTMSVAMDFPEAGCMAVKINIEDVPFASTIDLPAPLTETGPTEIVDGSTVNWDGSTLSFNPAAGANSYVVSVIDDGGHFGELLMFSNSVTFPPEFVSAVLDAGLNWDLSVFPVWTQSSAPLDVSEHDGSLAEGSVGSESKTVMIQIPGVTKADAIP